MFFVIVGFWQTACMQDAANKVVVTIMTVKEGDWLSESIDCSIKTALRERLQARTLVGLSGELKEVEEAVLRTGQVRGIVISWEFAKGPP